MKSALRVFSVILALLMLSVSLIACNGGGASKELVFKTSDGVTVAIGAEADPIISQLGTPGMVNSSDSCGGFVGKDYVYTYMGFRVSTTPADGYQMICKVELTDDSVKTPEGLYIGMGRADVEAAMEGYSVETVGVNLSYSTETVMLNVTFRDGYVSGIIYVAK